LDNERENEMHHKQYLFILLILILIVNFNCAPSLRSAKIQPGFSVDGVALGTVFSADATDEQGNDVTEKHDIRNPVPFDVKFRYGWARKRNFGLELSGGLDGQIGAYLELPGTNALHWGIGAETNFWLLAVSRLAIEDKDEDEVGDFIRKHNYNAYLIGGYFPNQKIEISVGIRYQPFLKTLLEETSKDVINVGNTLPVTFLIDGRYLFTRHWGIIAGTEFFNLNFSGVGQEEARINGGYIYIGLTFR
jgi:hypothetical protein